MIRFGILCACLWAANLAAQSLTDRFKAARGPWELQIEQGEAPAVRKGVEALLGREGLAVNPSDYNDMHALVALRSLAARACISEGSWEDAIAHFQKAHATAEENLTTSEPFLTKTRAEHEAKLKEFRDAVSKYGPQLKAMDEAPGLVADQIKQRQQLKIFMDEQHAAIAHGERAISDVEAILSKLREAKETTAKAVSDWQALLAAEEEEVARAGGRPRYVSEKLSQVKAGEANTRPERLAHARRLQKLDPSNQGVLRLVNGLLGKEEMPAKRKPLGKKG